MSTANASRLPSGPNLRSLQRDLATAQDDQIRRVLALIDSLGERGEADRLVAPMRSRLAELRPRRRLTLMRLLFTPLNPLIVDSVNWSAAAPSIPRTALLPLAGQVQDQLGSDADAINATAMRHSPTDGVSVLLEIGAELWSAAAKILATAPVPADWAARTGLGERDHVALANPVSILLAQAVSLLRLVDRSVAGSEPDAAELYALLEAVAPAGGRALAMMMALVMGWLPQSQLLLRVAEDFAKRHRDPAVMVAADNAVEFVLARIEEAPLPSPDLTVAATDARRIATMLDDLTASSAQMPRRRNRVEQVRRDVDTACCKRFVKELEAQLVVPSAGIAAAGDDEVTSLEATARGLRRFEAAARHIGSAEYYDRQLQGAAEALRPVPGEDAAARVSRIRLVEILRGPDAAMAMLG